MVFSTYHPTRYRSWIGYWTVVCVLLAVAATLTQTEAGALIGVLGAPLLLHVGWFALIALDVRQLGDTLDGAGNWLYPFTVLLGVLGVLLYLWDRERNLPSKPRREAENQMAA